MIYAICRCASARGRPPERPHIYMMNKLPFLKGSKWPRMAKPMDEKEYGFSEDDKLLEESVSELLAAWEAKDHVRLVDALKAIIHFLKAKEGRDAPDPFEASGSV
jgi:hypothetical protein